MFKRLVFAIAATTFSNPALALEYHGRLTLGTYVSTEKFSEDSAQGTSNDFAAASTRLYLEASKFRGDWSAVADVRDKYDFFDKLDREALTLTPTNTPQLRQLSLRAPEKINGVYWAIGRFPVVDAGAVYTDGVEAGYRFDPSWSLSLFGGMNPKRAEQSYVQYNPGCENFGAYLLYQPPTRGWGNSIYFTNSIVNEVNFGHLDRQYWFENLVFQPDPANRLTTLTYVDLVPRANIQNANLSYSHDFDSRISASAGVTMVDAIQYFRLQGVLEVLPPSPYREVSLRGRYLLTPVSAIDVLGSAGVRQTDGMVRRDLLASISASKLGDKHFSAYFGAGVRRNFTSNDLLSKFGAGYYTDKWELTLDGTFGRESFDAGDSLTPLTLEAAGAVYFSRSVFATASLQAARDERVQIFSTFFKLGYRFGTKEVSPIRDGAPPRGKL